MTIIRILGTFDCARDAASRLPDTRSLQVMHHRRVHARWFPRHVTRTHARSSPLASSPPLSLSCPNGYYANARRDYTGSSAGGVSRWHNTRERDRLPCISFYAELSLTIASHDASSRGGRSTHSEGGLSRYRTRRVRKYPYPSCIDVISDEQARDDVEGRKREITMYFRIRMVVHFCRVNFAL